MALDFDFKNTYELSDKQRVEQFFKSRKSRATAGNYYKGLSYVLGFNREDREGSFARIADFVTFAKQNRSMVEFKLTDWILEKKDCMAGATLRSYVSAVKSLLEYCGAPLNWKQIISTCPQAARSADDNATPLEATRKLFKIGDLRVKFLVSLFVSSGVRVGSLDYLLVRDLQEYKVSDLTIGILTIYHGEPEEYKTFISSECLNLWKEYRSERERLGETVTDKSPLIRNMTSIFEKNNARHLSSNSVRDLFSDLWIKAGVLNRNFKEIHGFRKFFKTRLESAEIKSVRIERLMGHVQGIEASYDKPTLEELAKDYTKVQHLLTIDESLIAKTEVKAIQESTEKNLKEQKVDLILANQKIASLEAEKLSTAAALESLMARVTKLEKD